MEGRDQPGDLTYLVFDIGARLHQRARVGARRACGASAPTGSPPGRLRSSASCRPRGRRPGTAGGSARPRVGRPPTRSARVVKSQKSKATGFLSLKARSPSRNTTPVCVSRRSAYLVGLCTGSGHVLVLRALGRTESDELPAYAAGRAVKSTLSWVSSMNASSRRRRRSARAARCRGRRRGHRSFRCPSRVRAGCRRRRVRRSAQLRAASASPSCGADPHVVVGGCGPRSPRSRPLR